MMIHKANHMVYLDSKDGRMHKHTYTHTNRHGHGHTHAHTHTVYLSIFILIFISGQTSLQYSDILSNYIVVFETNQHTYRFISSDYNLIE